MNRLGIISEGGYTYSYQIGETPLAADTLDGRESRFSPSRVELLAISGYYVYPAGVDNLEPNVADDMISGNRLLPELIEKQCKILYGRGPMLYVDTISAEGSVQRKYVHSSRIAAWLDSWKDNGLPDSFETYVNKAIRSYYYSEGIFSKWHLTRGYRAGMAEALPVAGLEHISELRCRMATTKNITGRADLEDRDFDSVMVGNWVTGSSAEFKVYPRLNFTRPLSRNSVVSYSKNPTHGQEIYATNVFFKGIKDWIRGCNLTPSYINSYLENSLSARLHVIIPNAWVNAKEQALQQLCEINAKREMDHQELITIKIGKKKMDVGTEYSEDLLSRYIGLELKNFTEFMSGAGKNQGKVYATRSFINDSGDEERWRIEEIPQKYKEFIEAIITYDKRADMVLLSAKGIDSSISNVSSEGIISKSGSDAYYNYMIYLTQQSIPEQIVCADVNYALKLNFPEEYASGIRVGFYRPTVKRQEETSPSERMSNQNEL